MLRFTIPNMVCGGCAKGVIRAIQGVDAQAKVQVDTAEREVRVENRTADEAIFLAALAGAGFPAGPTLAPTS